MSYHHAIRITLPFVDCSGIITQWVNRSQRGIVYQHDADEKVSKTHVHIVLGGCETKAEALKRMWKNAPGKGNEFWSWKDWDENMVKITYLSKGRLEPIFVKNFSKEEVDTSRQNWVEPVKADKSVEGSESHINKVIAKVKSDFVYRNYTMEEMIEDNLESSARVLLTVVRRETFKQLWSQRRMFPHASHYKIVAGTVYMRLCEFYGCFEEGIKIISELWL